MQVWLDSETEGSDQLKIEILKERITAQNKEGLYLDDFRAIDSKANYYIQAVDLFTASINRKLHSTSHNYKDELADYIFDLLNFSLDDLDRDNTEIDNSTVFNLTCNNEPDGHI